MLIRWNKTEKRFEPSQSWSDGHYNIEFEYPPIPVRCLDYSAVTTDYDGPGSPYGSGATPAVALMELLERIEEESD